MVRAISLRSSDAVVAVLWYGYAYSFVPSSDPAPGPVLANTGLNGLAFQKPVSSGDEIRVRLTAKRKTRRNEEYGEVAWNVTLFNQDDDQVAEYELLTMVAYTP